MAEHRSFEDRDRMTYEAATESWKKATGWIAHILRNKDDGSFSIMRHINCEWCDYCDAESVAGKHGLSTGWSKQNNFKELQPFIHDAKPDPYSREKK